MLRRCYRLVAIPSLLSDSRAGLCFWPWGVLVLCVICLFSVAEASGQSHTDTLEQAHEPQQQDSEKLSFVGLSSDLQEGLRLVGQGDLTPPHRARWVARLSAQEVPLRAVDLQQLFLLGGSHNAHIDGARIAVARQDPALIPLMFEAFLNSKVTRSTFDPDIFERLLRGLQAFPTSEVRKRLADADLSFVAYASRERLSFDWLQPLATGHEGALSPLDPAQAAAAQRTTRTWLADLLDPSSSGLTGLQTDSGDVAFQLFRRLEAQHLAVMIDSGSPDEARLGLEVAVQSQLGTAEVREAVARRLEVAPNRDLESLAHRLQSPNVPKTALYPVVPLDQRSDDRRWLLSIPARTTISPLLLLGAVLGALPLLAVLLGGVLPSWRRLFFRAAAVGLAPLLLLLVELALAASGYQPLMDVRPAFNPNRAPPELFTEVLLEGQPYVVNLEGNSRQLAFLRDKPAEVLRVVTLGESSVHGTHYLGEESFSAILEEQLNDRLHDRRIEVINAGVGGALSDEIVHYARQSYVLNPDLLIMYFGNNDLADLMRLAEFRVWSPASVALRFVLDRIRLARLIATVLPSRSQHRVVAGGAWLDDAALDDRELRFLRRLSELNLRVNMERIVRHAAAHGIPTILALQGQNDDMCGATDEMDPSFHSGCFQQALRRVAREVGARSGVPVVDIPQALRFHAGALAEDGAAFDEEQATVLKLRREGAGHAMFYDTCHPTRLGHRRIGEVLAPLAESLLTAR